MNQSGFGTITLWLIIGLGGAAAIATYGMIKQAEQKGIYKQQNAQLEQTIADTREALQRAERLRKRAEIIVLDNMVIRDEIETVIETEREVIKEVIRNAPPEDCINQPIDPVLICLLDSASCEAGDSTGEATNGPDA